MNNASVNKYLRIVYFMLSISVLAISILNISLTKISTSPIEYSLEDYLFLIILIFTFVLVNKYSINLKLTKVDFSDFIVTVCYLAFQENITMIFIFFAYLLNFIIDYKKDKKLNLLTENVNTFNCSIIMLSAFISHMVVSYFDNIYYISSYPILKVIVFSIMLLLANYILYCIDLSFENNKLIIITLENGLYFIFLNFLICTIISSLAIYLYNFYGYSPIVFMSAFLIFISFSLNSLNRLRTHNKNLKNLSYCTTFLISKTDLKIKLQHSLQLIESTIPFVYCGIYLTRENYSYIYPLSYKCNSLVDMENLKFSATSDNNVYTQLASGVELYRESKYFSNSLNIVNSLNKEIKYAAAVPIKDCDNKTYGFVLTCFDRRLELNDELELISVLSDHIGMLSYHLNANIVNNIVGYKSYDGLVRYIDYNIKHKILFTLAIIEIKNYNEIIAAYNMDFYEAFKSEVSRFISKLLSPKDSILCFEKEDIYIVFNLLDSRNAYNKLDELAKCLKVFKYKNIPVDLLITYSTSEYPVEGINADEIIDSAYRKLNNIKSA